MWWTLGVMLVSAVLAEAAVVSLDSYNVDPGQISTSGLSAGGAMASQFHVAFSEKIMGVATVAGLPYYCARNLLMNALMCMSSPYMTPVDTLITRTYEFESDGSIDPTSNMANDRVYIYNGDVDSVVRVGNAADIEEYYNEFVAPTNMVSETSVRSEHGQPTLSYGVACDQLDRQGGPFINRCDYDGAYELSEHIYGGLQRPTGGEVIDGDLYEYDQTEFITGTPSGSSMDSSGWAYIPSGCVDKQTPCKLHVMFHGCHCGQYEVGDEVVLNAGYLEVAELNNIIVLFPQAVSTAISNPNGCWDWWGYLDSNYAFKTGPQMDAVMKMVDRVVGDSPPVSTAEPPTVDPSAPTTTPGQVTTTMTTAPGTTTPRPPIIDLEPHNIDMTKISTSGFGGGACMATQFHVVFSETIMGAGMVAGVPYYCAEQSLSTALDCMSTPTSYNIADLTAKTDDYESRASIDATSNMFDDRVWVFNGNVDSTINVGNAPKVQDYYNTYVDPANIVVYTDLAAEFGYPTVDNGIPCDQQDNPGGNFINRCSYDGAYELLQHIYQDLQRPTGGEILAGELLLYDTTPYFYFSPPVMSSMDTTGYVYIPSNCADKLTPCKLHVVFHGCHQGDYLVGDGFIRESGYLEVAELNDIILLFPQAVTSILNPNGCWDWWGYLNIYYAQNNGNQQLASIRMVDRITGNEKAFRPEEVPYSNADHFMKIMA